MAKYSMADYILQLETDVQFDKPYYDTISKFEVTSQNNSDMLIKYAIEHMYKMDVLMKIKKKFVLNNFEVYKLEEKSNVYKYQFLFYDRKYSENEVIYMALADALFENVSITGYADALYKINKYHINPIATCAGINLIGASFLPLHGSLALHASAINVNGKAYLFVGPSGIGKSTMRELWQSKGFRVIGNDRVIIHQRNNKLYCSGSPYERCVDWIDTMCYEVGAVFLINHGNCNEIVASNIHKLFIDLMHQCIPPIWIKYGIQLNSKIVAYMIARYPVYNFYFRPNVDSVDYCLEYMEDKANGIFEDLFECT